MTAGSEGRASSEEVATIGRLPPLTSTLPWALTGFAVANAETFEAEAVKGLPDSVRWTGGLLAHLLN